jgi:hypothetical protein
MFSNGIGTGDSWAPAIHAKDVGVVVQTGAPKVRHWKKKYEIDFLVDFVQIFRKFYII